MGACVFCGSPVDEMQITCLRVIGSTKVFTPSTNFKDTPYYVLLLQDEHGNLSIKRSLKDTKIGEPYDLGGEKKDEYIIGIIGTGTTGKGLVQVCLSHNYRVIWKTRNKKSAHDEWSKIENRLNRGYSSEEIRAIKNNLTITDQFCDLAVSNIIIEAVVEDFEVKKKIYTQVENYYNGVITSNTSSISIDKLAESLKRPALFAGMHFFTPIHKMRLVEVIRGQKTANDTVLTIMDLAAGLGKEPITLNDSPGFIVNRVLVPYLQESVMLLEQGVGEKLSIDTGVKLGLNFPMGPFELIDLIGLDIFKEMCEFLYLETKDEKFHARPLILQMISEGKLGKKTGEGFYNYP